MAPLRREWRRSAQLPADNSAPAPPPRSGSASATAFKRLSACACWTRPARFLYVSLGLLKDLEKQVITHRPLKTCRRGAALRHTAAALRHRDQRVRARACQRGHYWIGYIQWFQQRLPRPSRCCRSWQHRCKDASSVCARTARLQARLAGSGCDCWQPPFGRQEDARGLGDELTP